MSIMSNHQTSNYDRDILSGVRYSQIDCDCGNIMRLIKTEKRDSGIE